MSVPRDFYNKCITEYFDISDKETRKVLLSIDEVDQDQILTNLTSKLYDSIVNKVSDVDCGSIPQSAGDITKVENFEGMTDCLTTIRSLLETYKQPTEVVDTVILAMKNIADRVDLFTKAFKYDVELPMVMYNMLVLACIASTSFLISASIEFVKNPNDEAYSVSINKVGANQTSNLLMHQNLEKFNKACANGQFDKVMESVISTRVKNMAGVTAGVAILAGVAITAAILAIIPIIRELIFMFYLTRVRLTDYFEVQAALLEMNALNIEASTTIDPKKRKEIIKRQASIASSFRKIANFVEVKTKDANSKALKEIGASNQKLKIKDVADQLPDSAGSSLF